MSVVTGTPDSLADAVKKYGLEAKRHGLVGLDAKGEPQVRHQGHMFGRTPEMAKKVIDETAAELLKK